jgi:hypothetical protein
LSLAEKTPFEKENANGSSFQIQRPFDESIRPTVWLQAFWSMSVSLNSSL